LCVAMVGTGRRRPNEARGVRRASSSGFADHAAVLGELALLVWHRKVWWLVPLLAALLLLGALLLFEATPIGPLLYPVF
jgi:hypothetical protein